MYTATATAAVPTHPTIPAMRFSMTPLSAPPFGVHRPHGQEQPEGDETHVVDQVLGVDHALHEVVEVLGHREVLRERLARRPQALADQSTTQRSRNTPKVAAPAKSWLFV